MRAQAKQFLTSMKYSRYGHPTIRVAAILTVIVGVSSCGGGTTNPPESTDPPPTADAGPNPESGPTVNAGSDRVAVEGRTVILSGVAEDSRNIRSYRWEQISGTPVALDSLGDVPSDEMQQFPIHLLRNQFYTAARFTAPDAAGQGEVLAFRLTAGNWDGDTGSDEVQVTVREMEDFVQVSGRITFDYVPVERSGLQYSATEARPVRGVTVQVRDEEAEQIVDATFTDEDGNYTAYALRNGMAMVRARAEIQDRGLWDARVVDYDEELPNTCFDYPEYALYAMDSAPFETTDSAVVKDLHAPSGWTGLAYGEERVAAPFAIVDAMYDAMQSVRSGNENVDFPTLHVYWTPDNSSAFFRPCNTEPIIALSGAENADTDEYDRTVILYNWALYFLNAFARDTTPGGTRIIDEHMELAAAFEGGFAIALAGAVAGSDYYINSNGSQQRSTSTIPLENYVIRRPGWFNVGSMFTILYDLMDPIDDDVAALGIGPMADVVINDLPEMRSLTSIFSFITRLKNRYPEHAAAIDSVVRSQRIETIVDEWGSTETNAGYPPHSEVLPVYTQVAVDGGAVNVCSVTDFASPSAGAETLGVIRYIRFSVPSQGGYTAVVRLTSAPEDSAVRPAASQKTGGAWGYGNTASCTAEEHDNCMVRTFMPDLEVGDHVLGVWDYENWGLPELDLSGTPGSKCFDVEIISQ